MSNNLTLRVMMLGGRRAGKTSALAAMQDCFDKQFKGTELNITPSGGRALDVIEAKRVEMERYLTMASRDEPFVPDSAPTQGDDTYRFNVRLKDRPDVISLDFYDFNGEWLVAGNPNYDDVQDQIKRADVIMIIIDTPYLMEEDGTYNDVRNRCFRITAAMKDNFDVRASVPKMVLFVPIKCERYYDENRMGDVYKQIVSDHCYGSLIDFLKGSCEMAVTPIQTIGTASFMGFDFDPSTGNCLMLKETDGKELPGYPLYNFTQKAREAAKRQGLDRKYAAEPMYCEQPAVYTLYYALTYAAQVAKAKADNLKKGPFGFFNRKLVEVFLKTLQKTIPSFLWNIIPPQNLQDLIDRFSFASAEEFLKQRNIIFEKMERSGKGFDILLPDILDFRGEGD
ncbi:MAG: hypothetical protein IJQ81_09835 [Oscillibacter sp.]|nr:hypothetical protein [Oscillibacter sp.]